VIRRGEWEDALRPHERSRASYRVDALLPLAEAGVVEFVSDDQTIMPGVRVQRTGGHTMHHQMVLIESAGRRAVFTADLVPTAAHLGPAWIAAFDLFPMDTLAAKKALLEEVADTDTLLFFPHDPAVVAGRVVREQGKLTVSPAAL
jgi:glyoxylase-like metal-dependent hydrolase (beta-lactamase superfamily II)